jgi:hypothetical protein
VIVPASRKVVGWALADPERDAHHVAELTPGE